MPALSLRTLFALLVVALLLALQIPAAQAGGITRVAGPDRTATAAAAALDGWDRADTVVIVRADDAADALSGTALAAAHDAPLLTTYPHELAPAARRAVRRLSPRQAVLIGGPTAISRQVVDDLRAAGVTRLRRLSGQDRADTAAQVADEIADGRRVDTVLLVGAWPDALAAAATAAAQAAAGTAWPVLHTTPDAPYPATWRALEALRPRRVVLVGGPDVLSGALADRLRGRGLRVARVAGADRYATAVKVADLAPRRPDEVADPARRESVADTAPDRPEKVVAVTGTTYADAVSAGAYAARTAATVALVPPTELPEPTHAWLSHRRGAGLTVLGGPTAVSDRQARNVRAALRGLPLRAADAGDPEPTNGLAQVGSTLLRLPSRHPIGGGFHQANSPASLQMDAHPAARLMTLPSRGRGTGSRTALDLAVEPDTPVLAAATGTVVEARSYTLYGSYRDQLVVIRDDAGRTVRMLHLDGVDIAVGERVTAGVTRVAARARLLPFASQIDDHVGRRPHVHLEVR